MAEDDDFLRHNPRWLSEYLACPNCHAVLTVPDAHWRCTDCGVVGRRTAGFPDFLLGVDHLPLAGGDSIDLRRDADLAAQLAAGNSGFAELCARSAEFQAEALGRPGWSGWRQRACDRALGHVSRVNVEGSELGGDALLAKIDIKVGQCNWPALASGIALEAGGGAGSYLPAFSRRFQWVVFVDASAVNLVLADRLCQEQGIRNVAFVRADVAAPPLASGRFDLIHENGVIEHVHSPRRMLAEAVRLRSQDGYLVCVSPNRFTIAPEPHFGLPLYGLIPSRLREVLVPVLRGLEDGVGTQLLSLRELRRELAVTGDGQAMAVFFLPRHLPFTARQTPARRFVRQTLDLPVVGSLVDKALNEALLGLAPQHIVVARAPVTLSNGGP